MLTLFVVLPSHVIAALPSPPIPCGVFALIKAGAPTGSSVLSNPDVDGISLRIGWSSVNPSEDKYDWSYFDAEITKAKNAGKKVLIRVSDGGKSLPDWVVAASKAAGEPSFSFYEKAVQGGAVITEPVFWAPTLLAKKAKLLAAFGARYDSNPTVAIVTCQFAGARSDDWGVPSGTAADGIAPSGSTETSRLLAAGYTTAKMVNAGNVIVSDTMAAFPSKPVGLAIGRTSKELDPQGADYVAETVINTARAKYGDRMVATHNSMSEQPPVPPPPAGGYWAVIYNMRPAVGGQMLWWSYGDSTCRNAIGGAPCDAATVLTHSVERAHDYGWNYLEIYNADVVGLPSVIHYAHGLLTATNITNISTRASVQTGQGVTIAGFIVTGTASKQVVVRGLGPSLTQSGVSGVLADPTLQLFDGSGKTIFINDNWKETQQAGIQATGLAPPNDAESAMRIALQPGNYTAVLSGKNDTTGVGLVEVYDIETAVSAELTNASTRGFVGTGDNRMIGGFITSGGNGRTQVVVRGLGPTLTQFGVSGALADPALTLVDDNGNIVGSNNNWKDTQQAEIQATGKAPPNDLEAAILVTVPAGNYTAILEGNGGGTGIGLVDIYKL
jgi:hypothetical protein